MGAKTDGSIVTNFANGRETLAHTLDHATTGHGMGVTTVALVYDDCDHDPVKKPGTDTTEATKGGNTDEVVHIGDGETANLGPSNGTDNKKDLTKKTTDHSIEKGTGEGGA